MRRAILVLALIVLAGPPQGETAPSDTRTLRIEHWLKAVLHHDPGLLDDAVKEVGTWSNADLEALWIDATALVALMHEPRSNRFTVRADPKVEARTVQYSRDELARLRMLACAASGKAAVANLPRSALFEPACAAALADLDSDLRLLAQGAHDAAQHGDENYLVRRGALLHADIAMAGPAIGAPASDSESTGGRSIGGPRQFHVDIADGRPTNVRFVAIHWIIARMLLDDVRPKGAKAPAPGRDDMVRAWYRATAAWMQGSEDHHLTHLDRARQLFPNDPDILFLSACQREVLAAPRIQEAVRATFVPTGFSIDVRSDHEELRRAAALFRRALAAKPDFPEAHLRLGRVLSLLARHDDAAPELERALASTRDPLLVYYASLFLGAVREALHDPHAARELYEGAGELYPYAQSPLLALSELAHRSGDRAGALRAIERLFELRRNGERDSDPWWRYHLAQARNVDELLDVLRQPFRASHLQ